MATGDTSYPFDNGQANEPEFRRLFELLGDGIVADFTGGAFTVSVNTATQEVTVGPGRARCAAAELNATQSQVFGLGSVGTQPTAGQVRRDRVIVRTDYQGNLVERALKVGTVNQPAPTLNEWNPSGVQELSLWQIVRTATTSGVSIQVIDERIWLGRHLELREGRGIPLMEIGSSVRRGLEVFHRQLVGGSPDWVPGDFAINDRVDGVSSSLTAVRDALGNLTSLRDGDASLAARLNTKNPANIVPMDLSGANTEWAGVNDADGRRYTILGRVTVPDPGWDYRLQIDWRVEMGSKNNDSSTRWDPHIWVGPGTSGDMYQHDYSIASSSNIHPHQKLSRLGDAVYTGPCRVELRAYRAFGAGNGVSTRFNRGVGIHRWRA